ncbi:MAG TPA: DUF5082 family protein [Bacillaceae bacterium]
MADNTYIINQLYNEISSLNAQIHQNIEKLVRLKQALQNISMGQGEFFSKKPLIDQPVLSAASWAGRRAERFLDMRSDMEEAFNRIGNQDIERMLTNIEEKISYYEAQNRSLESSIASKRSAISQLRNSDK